VLIHILIWAVFGVMYYFQPFPGDIVVPYQLWIKNSIILALLIIAFYSNSFFLVPRFLLKNRNGIYFLFIVGLVLVIVLLNIYVDEWLKLPQLMDVAFHKHRSIKHPGGRNHEWDIAMIAMIALVLGISTSMTAIQKWQLDRQKHQEMEQDKISSELSFLKAQINPHFFFNTLNNIYALTHIDADTSRKAIHQLSRMMRYVLYDTQNATTHLSQEIAFVKDYISLMQLRLTDAVKINFTSPEGLKEVAIAPMIFLPFIENAFKHGVSATSPSFIDITISQQSSVVDLLVVNTVIKEQNNNLEAGSGIGLNNTLKITEDAAANTYAVHLTLDLS